MKKTICLVICLLFMLNTGMAWAAQNSQGNETPEPSNTPLPSEQPNSPEHSDNTLSIDTKHVYEGMKRSYEQGYAPVIEDNQAVIVLPILAEELEGPLTVSVGLGDASQSPFVYRNYQKEFEKKRYTFEDEVVECYLVSFILPLREDRINGSYPVVLSLQGSGKDGSSISQDNTLYVAIEDGKSADALEPELPSGQEVTSSTPKSVPKLMIIDYALAPEYLEAGAEGMLDIRVKNTSSAQKAKNIKFSLEEESGEILPLKTSGGYCKEIKKGGEYTWQIPIRAIHTATSRPHSVSITMEYEDENGLALTAVDQIILEIRQQVRLEYDRPIWPEKVVPGDTAAFSMNVMNLGKSTLYNVLLTFDIPEMASGSSVLLGTMQPGESKMGSANFRVGEDVLGNLKGTVLLSYEDDYGQSHEKAISLATTVEKKTVQPASQEVEKKDSPAWVIYLIAGVVLAAVIAMLAVRSWKKRKQREQDEKLL